MSEEASTPSNDSPSQRPIAVALSYDAGNDAAPRVVASGQGSLAERIISKAKEEGVPLLANTELALLLRQVELETIIPVEAFAAVAVILACLYRADRRLAKETVVPTQLKARRP